MTVELARRLLRSRAAAPAELEAALHEALTRRTSLPAALAEHWPETWRRVELELERVAGERAERVEASAELASRLPLGMCERLMAVPLQTSTSTVVELACVDVGDPHVAVEFAFHLQAEVRTLWAPLAEIAAAIDGLHAGGSFVHSARRVLSASADEAQARRSTAPGIGAPPAGSGRSHKPSGRPSSRASNRRRSERRSTRSFEHDISGALSALDKAATPDEALERVVESFSRLAARVLVFAVRTGRFEGRVAAGLSLTPERIRSLVVPHNVPSVLRSTQEAGRYWGSLPGTPVHANVAELLDTGGAEIYGVRLSIAGKPALIALLSGLSDPFTTTRAADSLAEAASRALTRILRSKKNQT